MADGGNAASMRDNANPPYTPPRFRDRAAALVLLGTLLLMPPAIGVSLIDVKPSGIPFPLIYIFTVWIVLIVGALKLAKPLADSDQASDPGGRGGREAP